jgi:hypothetical protein
MWPAFDSGSAGGGVGIGVKSTASLCLQSPALPELVRLIDPSANQSNSPPNLSPRGQAGLPMKGPCQPIGYTVPCTSTYKKVTIGQEYDPRVRP